MRLGHQAVARALRRRPRQHRRFNLEESQLVQRLANLENDPVPQLDVAVQSRPPQIEITIPQPRLLGCGHLVLDLKRWRLRRCSGCAASWPSLPLRRWRFPGFAFCRRITRPSTATTNSDRSSSAFACASGFCSLLKTICAIPARSRRSMKISWPRSRRRCTQPISTTSFSASAARSSPQYFVRFKFPSVSSTTPLRSDSRYSSNSFFVATFSVPHPHSRLSVNVPDATSSSPIMSAYRAPSLSASPSDFLNFISSGGNSTDTPPAAQLPRNLHRRGIGRRAHPRHKNAQARQFRRLPAVLYRQNRAIAADRKADALRRMAAEQLDQSVIPPAAANRILRAQPLRRHLKRCPRVVVESSHQPPVLVVRNARANSIHPSVPKNAAGKPRKDDQRIRGSVSMIDCSSGSFESSTRSGFVSIRRWLSAPKFVLAPSATRAAARSTYFGRQSLATDRIDGERRQRQSRRA